MAAAADDFGSAVGGRVWRSLVRRLQEMGALFGAITNQIGPLERVCSSACFLGFGVCQTQQ